MFICAFDLIIGKRSNRSIQQGDRRDEEADRDAVRHDRDSYRSTSKGHLKSFALEGARSTAFRPNKDSKFFEILMILDEYLQKGVPVFVARRYGIFAKDQQNV